MSRDANGVGVYMMQSRLPITYATSGGDFSAPPKFVLPPLSARLAAFDSNPHRMALSLVTAKAHPAYASARVLQYRRDGSGAARDTWVAAHRPTTQGNRLKSPEERYWEGQLGQPEYRGKCKSSVGIGSGERQPRRKVPLIPHAAPPASVHTALSGGPRSRGMTTRTPQARRHEAAVAAQRCDELTAQLFNVAGDTM
jgi:hypothetical protein